MDQDRSTLPVASRPQNVACARSTQPLNVWTASIDDLRTALSDEPLSAMQIAGQLDALRAAGVGYWEPIPDGEAGEAEMAAALRVWKKAVAAIPAPFALEAFEWWASTHSRRPSPGDIANRAISRIRDASERIRREAVSQPVIERPTEAEIEERRRIAAKLAEEFPMLRGAR